MEYICGGTSGLLKYEYPIVYGQLLQVLRNADVDVDSLSLVSTSHSDLHPDSILIVVSVDNERRPDLAERFGSPEYHIPLSESSSPSTATRDLASAIVQRWVKAMNS